MTVMGYPIRFDVLDDNMLRVRSGPAELPASFNTQAVLDIIRTFNEVIEFEHGLRSPRARPAAHRLDALGRRIRDQVLSGEQVMFLDQECRVHKGEVEIWVSGPPSLVNLPLELLHHDGQDLLYHTSSIARTLQEGSSHSRPSRTQAEQQERMRVLLVPAEPADLGPIYWPDTLFELGQQLWHFRRLGTIEWVQLDTATAPNTLERLRQLLGDRQRDPFDVVVLFAHGRSEPVPQIALVGPGGRSDWKSVRDMIPVLTCRNRLPRLVVLACCHLAKVDLHNAFGGFACQLVEHGVPAVLCMQSAVSTHGAACAVATACRGIQQSKPIGQVVLECRHRMGREAALPALWLHPEYAQSQPLVSISPLSDEQLLSDIRGVREMFLTPETIENMLDAFQYLEDIYPETATREQSFRDFLKERRLFVGRVRLREARQAGSREAAARELLALEHGCSQWAANDADVRAARAWVEEPLADLVGQGQALEAAGEWDAATDCFYQAVQLKSKGDHVHRLWVGLRERASLSFRYASASGLLARSEAAKKQGDTAGAMDLKRRGIHGLEDLFALYPKEYSFLEHRLTQLRADELLLQADCRLHEFDWQEAVRLLQAANNECPHSVDQQTLDLAQEGSRLAGVLQEARARAHQRGWAPAADLVEADGKPRLNNPLLARWFELQEVRETVARWRATAAVDQRLDALCRGISVPPTETQPPELIEAFRVGPEAPAAVEAIQLDVQPDTSDALRASLREKLGDNAPFYFAMAGEWEEVHTALGRLIAAGHDYAGPCHRVVVAALARMLQTPQEEGRTAVCWRELLPAYVMLLACQDYWRRWVQQRTEKDGTAIGETQRLVTGFRGQVAAWLAPRDDAPALLRDCSRVRTFSPEEMAELVALGLELADRALEADRWKLLLELWTVCLDLAAPAGRFNSTCSRIFRAAVQRVCVWSRRRDAADVGHCIELWRVVHRVLDGTDRAPEAADSLADALMERGLIFLQHQEDGDSLLLAHSSFEEAHNVWASIVSAAALVLTLVLLADQATDEADRDRLAGAAGDVLRDARRRWPADRLLVSAEELVELHLGRNDVRYAQFLGAILRSHAITADGRATTGLEDRARIALANGHYDDAVAFLLDALDQGAAVPPELVRQAFHSWLAPLFSTEAGSAFPDVKLGYEQVQRALQHCPDDSVIGDLRAKLERVVTYLERPSVPVPGAPVAEDGR